MLRRMDGAEHSERMMEWIGKAARAIREERGFSRADVASARGVGQSTVERFELGKQARPDVDAMLSAYARVTGVKVFDFWRRAIDMWEDSER